MSLSESALESATRMDYEPMKSQSELWPDSEPVGSDFWEGVLASRINHTLKAPGALQQYSRTTASSFKALDREGKVLRDALSDIRLRCILEECALKGALKILRERQATTERNIKWSIAITHHRLNALTPMARLPSEILARIFVFHAQMEPLVGRRNLNTAATSTRVCRQWRQAGLSCPELWSYITHVTYRPTAWVETMIERSRAVPLSFEVSTGPNMDMVALVAENLHRCKSLSLRTSRYWNLYSFFEYSSRPAPLLQRLEIEGSEELVAFPPDFLRGRAPNLHHLRFTEINPCSPIPWRSALFANLVSLEVNTRHPDNLLIEPLLSALARMPMLEVLYLNNCFPRPISSTVVATHAHLPNLRLFRITGIPKDCTYFLRQITVSGRAVVRVGINAFGIPKADVEEFFAVFPSNLYTTSPPVAQALQFSWRDGDELGVDARTVQQGTALGSSLHVTFRWKSSRSMDWWDKRLWDVHSLGTRSQDISPLDLSWACFAALASPQLQSFRISEGDIEGWDVEVWKNAARLAPELRRLSPGRGALSAELCKALHPPDGPDLTPADYCLPALSYLELAAPCDLPVSTPDGGESPLSAALARSLAARAAIGCSTPELVFLVSKGHSSEGWLEPLRDAVPGVAVREDHSQGEPAIVCRVKESELRWY
ncbi:hypothetical protein BD779DRAFT_1675704 [Infundibulicybe gibba]|nr:hypothetical protein BD779DRAFT_1675704 [Infundibulicybe gibba]